jgi:hypothetical protein
LFKAISNHHYSNTIDPTTLSRIERAALRFVFNAARSVC